MVRLGLQLLPSVGRTALERFPLPGLPFLSDTNTCLEYPFSGLVRGTADIVSVCHLHHQTAPQGTSHTLTHTNWTATTTTIIRVKQRRQCVRCGWAFCLSLCYTWRLHTHKHLHTWARYRIIHTYTYLGSGRSTPRKHTICSTKRLPTSTNIHQRQMYCVYRIVYMCIERSVHSFVATATTTTTTPPSASARSSFRCTKSRFLCVPTFMLFFFKYIHSAPPPPPRLPHLHTNFTHVNTESDKTQIEFAVELSSLLAPVCAINVVIIIIIINIVTILLQSRVMAHCKHTTISLLSIS